MALDIGEAVRDGVDRATERNGLVLMGAFVLLGVASAVVQQTLTAELAEIQAELPQQQEQVLGLSPGNMGPTPLAFPVPLVVVLPVALALALVGEALYIIAVRTFVSDERLNVPDEYIRRRIGWVTANGFLGGVVVIALVILPLVLAFLIGGGVQLAAGQFAGIVALVGGLLVGGFVAVFLYVAFFFVRQEIAVEDKNFVDAMAGSWTLTTSHRIEIFVLVFVIFIVELLVSLPTFGLSLVNQAASVLVNAVLSAVVSVFVVAIVARAYAQLRADEEEPEPEPEDQDVDEYTGALGPDDLDPPE